MNIGVAPRKYLLHPYLHKTRNGDHCPVGRVLTPAQKRDIFYNNAARFLRLSKEEIARHHSM
jgi:hypothetical protein